MNMITRLPKMNKQKKEKQTSTQIMEIIKKTREVKVKDKNLRKEFNKFQRTVRKDKEAVVQHHGIEDGNRHKDSLPKDL